MNGIIFAQYYGNHMMEYQHGGWGVLAMIFFVALIAAIAYLLLRSGRNSSTPQPHGSGPLDIAKSRYAKGEITKVQFDELKKDLKT